MDKEINSLKRKIKALEKKKAALLNTGVPEIVLIKSKSEAFDLLREMGASGHLIKHIDLVGEAAEILLRKCEEMHVPIDSEFVKVGVVIHDIGKTIHSHEMSISGSLHETEGEKILLEKGVSNKIARCCLSHSQWYEMECSLEELIIALSDNLWKGKRIESLELQVIDNIALALSKDRWDVFSELDSQFELIANDGDNRLSRSICS